MTVDSIIKAGSVIVAIGAIGAAYTYLDQTYAREEKVTALDQRLQQKITGDRYYQLQQRLWALQDRYGRQCERADKVVQDQCKAIIQELDELGRELKK